VHAPESRASSAGESDHFELYCRQHPISCSQVNDRPAVPENYRNLEHFVQREDWPSLLKGGDTKCFLSLVAEPTEEEGLKELYRQVLVFLDRYQAILKSGVPYGTRRDLGTRPS